MRVQLPAERVGDSGQEEEADEADHQTGHDEQEEEDRRHAAMPRTLAHADLLAATRYHSSTEG